MNSEQSKQSNIIKNIIFIGIVFIVIIPFCFYLFKKYILMNSEQLLILGLNLVFFQGIMILILYITYYLQFKRNVLVKFYDFALQLLDKNTKDEITRIMKKIIAGPDILQEKLKDFFQIKDINDLLYLHEISLEFREKWKLKLMERYFILRPNKILFLLMGSILFLISSLIIYFLFCYEEVVNFYSIVFSIIFIIFYVIIVSHAIFKFLKDIPKEEKKKEETVSELSPSEENKKEETMDSVEFTCFDKSYDPLEIQKGLVRFFLLMGIIFLFTFFILTNLNNLLNLPLQLLIIFNIPFIYYGFKPKKLLPKQFAVLEQSEVEAQPSKDLIDNIDVVKDLISKLEDHAITTWNTGISLIKDIQEDLKTLEEKIEGKKKNLLVYLKPLEILRENVTKKIDQLKVVLITPIDKFSEIFRSFPETRQGKYDRFNYIILLVVIIMLNIFFGEVGEDVVYFIIGAFIVGSGILTGRNINKAYFESYNQSIQEYRTSILQVLTQVKIKFNKKIDEIYTFSNTLMTNLTDYISLVDTSIGELLKIAEEQKEGFKKKLDNFMGKSILALVPTDVGAIFSITIMVMVSIMIFWSPLTMAVLGFSILQYIISFYFSTKKSP